MATSSMTGYGRSRQNVDGYEIAVEVKSVNHRYLEVNFRLPRDYQYLEEKLRGMVQTRFSRGKVELSLFISKDSSLPRPIKVDIGLAEAYITGLRQANETLGLPDDLSLSKLMSFREIFSEAEDSELSDAHFWQAVKLVTGSALDELADMRETEGVAMEADIKGRLRVLEGLLAGVEEALPDLQKNYETRFRTRLEELVEQKNIDESRVLMECGIFAERSDIHEEIARLKSHIAQMDALFLTEEAIGRKMDFIAQEMNREVNTIGSKVQDITVSRLVVEMKAEVEKIREQVQNLE